MIIGVSEGWTKQLQLIGVGYRATVNGNMLVLNLGFSHPVEMPIPEGIQVKVRPSWEYRHSSSMCMACRSWPAVMKTPQAIASEGSKASVHAAPRLRHN